MFDTCKGLMFSPAEKWRVDAKRKAHALNQRFNALSEEDLEERNAVLKELFGELKEGVSFNAPIRFHYGIHTKIGKGSFFNFNFTCQDDGNVTIGENCNFGPNVTVTTAMHPLLAEERLSMMGPDKVAQKLCWAEPVVIEDNCWICAGVTILPGVTIGKNSVIGAGSVVNRSIPSDCLAAGNPCRVIRKLGEKDSLKNRPDILGDCSVI